MNKEENIEIVIDSEFEGSKFRYIQQTKDIKKILEYDYKRCNGCSICIEICPKKAIEPGPLFEIATGMDAPPVILDYTKCSFCGICAAFCPVKAFKMKINDEDILEKFEYPHLDSDIQFNENCLPCLLCAKACPEEAIEIDFEFQDKETIISFTLDKKGEIEIDMDKCSLCGICAVFCPAFLLVDKESKPDSLIPFEDILIDKEKCDYCGLCAPLCPEDAIKVKGDFDEDEIKKKCPEIKGSIRIDKDKCTLCGWCKSVCPYDAVNLKKAFEGDIELIDAKLKECDPVGCHGCFNVCPSKAWIIPKNKKIDVVREFCTYCGACENACHINALKVKRDKVRHTDILETPWADEWKQAITSIVTGERDRPDISHTINLEKIEKENVLEITKPETNHVFREKVDEKISELLSILNNKSVRRNWETKNVVKAIEKIKKKI